MVTSCHEINHKKFTASYDPITQTLYVFAYTKKDFIEGCKYGRTNQLIQRRTGITPTIKQYIWVEINKNNIKTGIKTCYMA